MNKPVAIGCNIVKNPDCDSLKKDRYNRYFGEGCVDSFVNEMLAIETYLKNYFKNDTELNPDTIPENYDENVGYMKKILNQQSFARNLKKLGTLSQFAKTIDS